jgi:hypothetical protein
VSTEKKLAEIQDLLTTVGKKKALKYVLGRKHWTTKHISTMKRRLSKDAFSKWYKEYLKEIDK